MGTSRLHDLHEPKLPFVSRIEFIRSELSNFSAHVSGVSVAGGVGITAAQLRVSQYSVTSGADPAERPAAASSVTQRHNRIHSGGSAGRRRTADALHRIPETPGGTDRRPPCRCLTTVRQTTGQHLRARGAADCRAIHRNAGIQDHTTTVLQDHRTTRGS